MAGLVSSDKCKAPATLYWSRIIIPSHPFPKPTLTRLANYGLAHNFCKHIYQKSSGFSLTGTLSRAHKQEALARKETFFSFLSIYVCCSNISQRAQYIP